MTSFQSLEESLPQLRISDLDFSKNTITNENCVAMLKLINQLDELKNLILRECKIQNKDIDLLLQSLSSCLELVDLAYNCFDSTALESIAQFLFIQNQRNSVHLKSINVETETPYDKKVYGDFIKCLASVSVRLNAR